MFEYKCDDNFKKLNYEVQLQLNMVMSDEVAEIVYDHVADGFLKTVVIFTPDSEEYWVLQSTYYSEEQEETDVNMILLTKSMYDVMYKYQNMER